MPTESQYVIHASLAADSARLTPTAMKQADCAVRPIMKAMLGDIICLRTGRASCQLDTVPTPRSQHQDTWAAGKSDNAPSQPALWGQIAVITPALGGQVQQQHPTAPGMVCGLVHGHMPQMP